MFVRAYRDPECILESDTERGHNFVCVKTPHGIDIKKEWNTLVISGVSFVYKHLKIRIVMFL